MVGIPAVAAGVAFVIVSVMKTLLGWLGRERQGRDIRSRGGAGHDLGELTGCAKDGTECERGVFVKAGSLERNKMGGYGEAKGRARRS